MPGDHHGDLRIDGAPFVPTSCRSGEVFGFVGVQLSDADGRFLRLNLEREHRARFGPRPAGPWSGTPRVTLATPGAGTADLGQCGTLTIEEEDSKVIYRNVDGKAALACSSARRLQGAVQFEDCH